MSGRSLAGCPVSPPARAGSPHLHDALDVAVPFGEVHGSQTRSSLAVLHVRAEHRAGALSLPTDYAAHGGGLEAAYGQRPGGPGTPATPASGSQFPRILPPGLDAFPHPSLTVRPSSLSGIPPGFVGVPRARDEGGWYQSRRATNTSYLLPSAAGRGVVAEESRLIFRGGADNSLTFRHGRKPSARRDL